MTVTDGSAAIEIEGLWTVLDKSVVHRDVELRVRTGEVLAIIGGSGSGKTTLLREMLGLLRPTRGEVKVLGSDVRRLSRRERLLWPARCGVVFQNGALFSALSTFDNVALPVRETNWWPKELLPELVLTTLQATGIAASQATKLPAELSGGMVKRVALARALILEPELLFMDEPTSGLAPDQRHAVISLLARLKREFELTLIIITHDVDVVLALADRVAVLADQRIAIVAPVSEVAEFPHPFVRSFFLEQTCRCEQLQVERFRSRLDGTCPEPVTE
jgi:phospholipid/cholesterol/gamma-HCH transport system ATP-binding protein